MKADKTTADTYVFDAYGTLFDVHSAVARHAHRIGKDADPMSELWRARQVEYSWTYSLMGRQTNFWELTQHSLDYAMRRFGVNGEALRADLLASYLKLQAYPEVPAVLRRLKAAGKRVVILSNGTYDMVQSAVNAAGLTEDVDEVLSVDQAGIFKPSPRVYQLVLEKSGAEPKQVSFQSSNPWDAAGAGAFGFQVVWVNRRHLPSEYPLDFPKIEVASLEQLL